MTRQQIRYNLAVEVRKIEKIDEEDVIHSHLKTNRHAGAIGIIKGALSICGKDACYVEHDGITSVYLLTEIEPTSS